MAHWEPEYTMTLLRTIFAAVGALVVFGGLLYLIAIVAYHVERRPR